MPSRVSQSTTRQRTDQIDVFTTELSGLTIVWATIQGRRLRTIPVSTEALLTARTCTTSLRDW